MPSKKEALLAKYLDFTGWVSLFFGSPLSGQMRYAYDRGLPTLGGYKGAGGTA